MEKLRRPRGTRDFLPENMAYRKAVQRRLEACAERFGYGEVMTPTFELTELFLRKSGEGIIDQIYSFEDKGGRSLALRPELTAATVRLFAEGMRDATLPVRLYYFENCFRYERPQKGRYREFWQFGAELLGPDNPASDAEIVQLARAVLEETGLNEFTMRLGHVGVLKAVIDWCGVADEKKGADGGGMRSGGVMSMIDKGDMDGLVSTLEGLGLSSDDLKVQTLLAVVEGKGDPDDVLPRVRPLLATIPEAAEGMERLNSTFDLLKQAGVTGFTVDLGIARGLDYYTGLVFEADVESLGAEKQVVGGGRYELSELFGIKPTPMTGFALGFDRLCLALETEGVEFGRQVPDIYVIAFTRDDFEGAQVLVSKLRAGGFSAEGDLQGRNMKKGLSHASSRGARFIVFYGGEEKQRGAVVLKDSSTREQTEIPEGELTAVLKDRLG